MNVLCHGYSMAFFYLREINKRNEYAHTHSFVVRATVCNKPHWIMTVYIWSCAYAIKKNQKKEDEREKENVYIRNVFVVAMCPADRQHTVNVYFDVLFLNDSIKKAFLLFEQNISNARVCVHVCLECSHLIFEKHLLSRPMLTFIYFDYIGMRWLSSYTKKTTRGRKKTQKRTVIASETFLSRRTRNRTTKQTQDKECLYIKIPTQINNASVNFAEIFVQIEFTVN